MGTGEKMKMDEIVETACRAKHFLWPSFNDTAKATERHAMRTILCAVLETHVKPMLDQAYLAGWKQSSLYRTKEGEEGFDLDYAARIIERGAFRRAATPTLPPAGDER